MRLRDWLHQQRLSQAALARRLGVTRQCLSANLRGHRRMDAARVARIHALTGGRVTAADLAAEIADNRARRGRRTHAA